ncbi:hypothetical protein KI387_033997, partial [Taxus chinensis]
DCRSEHGADGYTATSALTGWPSRDRHPDQGCGFVTKEKRVKKRGKERKKKHAGAERACG